MALPTLSPRSSLDVLLNQLLYTFVRLRAHSVSARFAPKFETLLKECKHVRNTELELREAIRDAEAWVDAIDDELDDGVDGLSTTLLKHTQGRRDDSLYQRYFGSIRPSELKKPVLGDELEIVRGWLGSLHASPHTELQAMGKILANIVKKADTALERLREARAKESDFRKGGERERLFERANAERKVVYGELGQFSHAAIDKQVADFADRFFWHDRKKKRSKPKMSTELQTKMNELEATLQEVREHYQTRRAQEEAVAQWKATYEVEVRALEEAKQSTQERVKRVAELKNKIAKM